MLLAAVGLRAQTRGAVDWIFLIDTSASMRKNDLFAQVQGSLKTFVEEASDGDSVTLYTFDRDVHTATMMDIRGANRRDVAAVVDGLEAKGSRTHLGAAILKGLERSEELAARGDPTRTRAIVLFTDGKEDVKGIEHPVPIPEMVQRALQSKPWLFFVSLNEHEPQLDAFTNARILKPHGNSEIRQIAEEIRKIVPRSEPVPLQLKFTPAQLDFGSLERGQSVERELTIETNRSARISVSLVDTPGLRMAPHDGITVTPNAPLHLPLKLDVAEDAVPGATKLRIRAGHDTVPASVTILKPSPLLRAAKWLVAAAILAAIALLVRARTKPRNYLEGELEIVAPRVASDAAFVGLPALATNEVALSSIVPPDALNGSDARLFVRRANGQKQVCISASSGSTLRVNDVETPATDLYDADTIRIGAATLRFNRVGFERPQEDPSA
ncbi:MAG TPA: vWA domain-containing protein [Thermoanaerobaculia bacterium]|jgi:hypothetical protein